VADHSISDGGRNERTMRVHADLHTWHPEPTDHRSPPTGYPAVIRLCARCDLCGRFSNHEAHEDHEESSTTDFRPPTTVHWPLATGHLFRTPAATAPLRHAIPWAPKPWRRRLRAPHSALRKPLMTLMGADTERISPGGKGDIRGLQPLISLGFVFFVVPPTFKRRSFVSHHEEWEEHEGRKQQTSRTAKHTGDRPPATGHRPLATGRMGVWAYGSVGVGRHRRPVHHSISPSPFALHPSPFAPATDYRLLVVAGHWPPIPHSALNPQPSPPLIPPVFPADGDLARHS